MTPALAALAMAFAAPAAAPEPPGLHPALDRLAAEGRYSGAVVVRGAEGVRFARGYGMADPFAGRPYTPDTPADSASLAKPVTAAAILMLVRDGKLDLEAPVRRYLPEYPHARATLRSLLSHSAGLAAEESAEAIAGKSNAELLADVSRQALAPLFEPGSGFNYCNHCYVALAMLQERVARTDYLAFARSRLALPAGVALRPQRLADWSGRAIGHRRGADGTIERFDSWEGEAFYGSANLSVSAAQLAEWGARWWQEPLASIRPLATTPATIAGRRSGLTLGSWYCAPQGARCHYLGHHEGFHHMLYWDAERKLSVAMTSNSALEPALQQRLQRAIVAFAEGRASDAEKELGAGRPARPAPAGRFRLAGEIVLLHQAGEAIAVERRGIRYPAYPVAPNVRYVPGLDAYLGGDGTGRLQWLTLYEEHLLAPL